MTLKKQLLRTIILSTLVPMLIIPWAAYLYICRTVEKPLLLQSRRQLEEVTRDIEDMMDDIMKVSNVIAQDENIMNILKDSQSSVRKRFDVIDTLHNLYGTYLYQYMVSFCLYDIHDRVFSTLPLGQNADDSIRLKWVQETIANKAFFLWKAFENPSADDPVFGMSRNLYDLNGRRIGTLCIEIYRDPSLNRFLEQYSDLKNTERFLADEKGNFILAYTENGEAPRYTQELYSREDPENSVQTFSINQEKYILLQETIGNTEWKTIQIVPWNEVFAKLNYYRNFTYFINVICIALLILIDNYTAERISHSTNRLGAAMKQVRSGDFITLENHEKNSEMRQIYDDFNDMSTKLKQLFEENRRIAREKEEDRFLALQTQIQPHFLFNTLNGIKWLCIIESAPTAERMIESLGHILEYSLGNAKDCVALEEEITCLKHYVELQKMRYGNVFDIEYQIDEELRNFAVPVLILQPLVENSIVHGFHSMDERGIIRIQAKKIPDGVILSVEDNGEGMDPEHIRDTLKNTEKNGSIGLKNVKERAELYYADSQFEIISEKGKGTRIQITLGKERQTI